ncbi:MAG: hypothetical protein ACOC0D_07020 [Spirochaeta sp.]
MKFCAVLLLLCLPSVYVTAVPVYPEMVEVDWMLLNGDFTSAVSVLEEYYADPPSDVPLLEIVWRLAQATQYAAEDAWSRDRDKEIIDDWFAQSEQWVRLTVEIAPEEHHGYFWKAALIAQQAQVRGPLNSLFAAPEMRDLLIQASELEPQAGHIYYAASYLYHLLPRMISFGDRDAAVSLARAGLWHQRVMQEQRIVPKVTEGFPLQLARALWTRNWSHERRVQGQREKRSELTRTDHPFERAMLFEGSRSIPDVGDREEALQIIAEVEQRLSYPNPVYADRRARGWLDDLKEAWLQ